MADGKYDVLILGGHASAGLLALLLRRGQAGKKATKSPPAVAWCPRPTQDSATSLVTLNPAAAELHPVLGDLPDARPIHGVRFLGEDGASATWREDRPQAHVVPRVSLDNAVSAAAAEAGADGVRGEVSVEAVDEAGVRTNAGLARLAAVAVPPSADVGRALGVEAPAATHCLLHRSFAGDGGGDVMQVGFGLGGQAVMATGRLVSAGGRCEASVLVPRGYWDAAPDLLSAWLERLNEHGVESKRPTQPQVQDVALAGALRHDPVGDRTVLIGPAGGFLGATGEEMYPALWSAAFAADVIRSALKADFPQDELQAYRGSWGGSLGEYLRGPQQNLAFLLPLIFGKPNLARRLGEALLRGESLVR